MNRKWMACAVVACACEGQADVERAERAPQEQLKIDRAAPVLGVADRERDPAVVALSVADRGWCSGILVSADVVLTSRSCLAEIDVTCPAEGPDPPFVAPAGVAVALGDVPSRDSPVARGRSVVVSPEGACASNAALLVLDRPIPHVRPALVRTHGVASGDFVRTVSFVAGPEGDVWRSFRDHVRVGLVSASEVAVFEACASVGGGVALDDETGEVVGVLSRAGPECGVEARNVYARVDALGPLVAEAIAQAKEPPDRDAGVDELDAGRPRASDLRRPGRAKPPTDLGGACASGGDCAAGVCVDEGKKLYCSRGCGPRDRCPSGYQCRRGVPFGGDGGAGVEVSACVRR
jgi:hypothetical protein